MSTLKTNNIQHVDAASPSISLDTGGNVSVSGIVTATKFSLSISSRNGISGINSTDSVTNVKAIRFDSNSGFGVTDIGDGEVFVNFGSAFNPWTVAGQTTLDATGEEEIEFIAGSGIEITTNTVSTPKSITFTSTGGGGTSGIDTTGTSFFNQINATGIVTSKYFNHFEVLSGTTNVIQSVMGGDLRYNDNNASWTTTHPGGASSGNITIYADDGANNATNRELLIRLGLGYWNPSTPQTALNSIGVVPNRMLLTGRDNSIGAGGDISGYSRNFHYAPIISHILPIRNNSGSNINVNIAWSRSNQYGDYNGSMMMLVTPTNSSGTLYSTVNGTTVTVLNTTGRYAVDSVNVTGTQTGVTIAAGKTCLLVQISTARNLTTNSMTFKNMFNDVNSLFTNSNIQCDLRMVSTLVNANWYAMGWTSATQDLYKVWNICATLHGDR